MAKMTYKEYMEQSNEKTHNECESYKVNDKDIYIKVLVTNIEGYNYMIYRDISIVKNNGFDYYRYDNELNNEIDDDFLEELAFEAIPNYEENKVKYTEHFRGNVTSRILKSDSVTQLPCEQCPWRDECIYLDSSVTNRYIIEDKLKDSNRVVGCFDEGISYLDKENLDKILEALEFGGDTDVTVSFHEREYVVKIVTTSLDEVNFRMSRLR